MARDNEPGGLRSGNHHGDSLIAAALSNAVRSDAALDELPVDIAAVRRDDQLIDAIIARGSATTDNSDPNDIATLFASWRAEIVEPPLPSAPDLDDVVEAVEREIAARRIRVGAGGRLRVLRPILGAAAAIAVVVGGLTAISYSAEPGDPLWNVKQVVFSSEADSTVANMDTTSDLQDAERLIALGKLHEAKVHLDQAADRVSDINDDAQRDSVRAWVDRLQRQLDELLP